LGILGGTTGLQVVNLGIRGGTTGLQVDSLGILGGTTGLQVEKFRMLEPGISVAIVFDDENAKRLKLRTKPAKRIKMQNAESSRHISILPGFEVFYVIWVKPNKYNENIIK
jgi:hypothetical protein